MIRLVTLLTLVALLWSFFAFKNTSVKTATETPALPNEKIALTTPVTLGLATTAAEFQDWLTYRDDKHHFQFRYPSYIQIKASSDGSLALTYNSLQIYITPLTLSYIDTVNTMAEKDIDELQKKLGTEFKLLETISPIAIGSQTGLTYTTEVSGHEVTSYYIPQDKNYLLIENKTTENPGESFISLSDDIIYSLEIL